MESNNNNYGKWIRNLGLAIGIPLLIGVIVVLFLSGSKTDEKKRVYSDYLELFATDKVESLELDLGNGNAVIHLKAAYREDTNKDGKVDDDDVIRYAVPNVGLFVDDIEPYLEKLSSYDYIRPTETPWFVQFLPSLVLFLGLGALVFFSLRRFSNNMENIEGGRFMGFGKSHIKPTSSDKKKTTFADVAGAEEEKEELAEIVEFLRTPKKFKELGARVPKGVLLVGPPGTGKTLLARAVAGEAGVQFFSMSGSDFVEMYVGLGASRVRDLFEQAKKNSPCIVFIDEIDAVGRQRGAGLGGGHDEREQTLNQLLVEMDGFAANEGVIMMAATNRPDILDPALMRPGRFDRQIVVSYPDVKGRLEILKVHAKGKPLAPDVDLSVVAKSTVGFTGADLENLLNEAALLAARRSYHSITMTEIEEATLKVIMGTEKKSRVITENDKRLTAFHEAGHAVISYYCPTQDPVHQISIIPRGMAGGFTMSLSEHDKEYVTKTRMLEDIQVLLGGRIAEDLVLGDISTGASNDLERSTKTARQIVTKYGMSEKVGPIVFGSSESGEVFLGRDFAHTRDYSETTAAIIDEEVKSIITVSYAKARQKLTDHNDKLHAVAEFLLENEKMDGEQFKAIMEGREIPAYSENNLFIPTEDPSETPEEK